MMSPPELGRLDLNLVIKHGHLQANMSAETLVAKEMIEANLSQLKQQLNNLGLVVDRFEVGVGLEDRRFADGDPRTGNKRKGTSPGRSSNREETPTAAAAETESGHPDLYQIDVHV
jgi:flagellar hook-length control protein FliK